MNGKIKLLIGILFWININVFAQTGNEINVSLRPGKSIDKTLIISDLPLSVTIMCNLDQSIDFGLVNNSEKTLWFAKNTVSYGTFHKKNKSTWTNKEFKLKNDHYFFCIADRKSTRLNSSH